VKVTTERLELATPGEAVEGVTVVVHRPSRARRPAFLLTHGAGGDLDSPGLVALCEAIAGRGHLVVRANLPFREAGRKSPPRADRSVSGFVAVATAARELAPRTPWIVGGKSYGGRVASLAVAQGLDAVGLLFYGYPLHPPGKPDKLRVDHWPDIKVPCLFLQGDRDTFSDPDLLENNLLKLPRRAKLHVVAGGDHSLKVTRAAAPDGEPRSAAAVVASLGPLIDDWADHVVA
jgi:predicted alpha/beta-hydrolase family hydrolase